MLGGVTSVRRLRALLYGAVIVYGSLFPFTGWRAAPNGLLDFLTGLPDFRVHRADALTNVLAYIPLGLFLVRDGRSRPIRAVLFAALGGAALSLTMEFLQQFLPQRVASLQDVATNAIGSLIGALVGVLTQLDVPVMTRLARWRGQAIVRGSGEEFGLLAVGLWALSQWAPFVPSLDVGELRAHLSPLRHTLLDPARFDAWRFAIYSFNVSGLAYLARTVARDRRFVLLFAACAIIVVFGKVLFAGRSLSLEAAAGTLFAGLIALPAFALGSRHCAVLSAALLLAGLAAAELRSEPSGVFYAFTWIPFRAQLENPLTGIASLLETLWPAIALSYLARFIAPSRERTRVGWLGAVALSLYVFTLEWHQQFVRGRVGDVTSVLLIAATWGFCWIAMAEMRALKTGIASTHGSYRRIPGQGDRT
jgi:VanZ family protein